VLVLWRFLVLLYDHRGIGDSTLTPAGDEQITIELLARDLVELLAHLKWKEVALCGFSMGGTVLEIFPFSEILLALIVLDRCGCTADAGPSTSSNQAYYVAI